MTSILFQATPHAYLPEIDAYRHYISKHYPHIRTYDSRHPASKDVNADVLWRFMGIDLAKPTHGQYLIHDYNSLSTGKVASIKNSFKKFFNRRPNRRVFLNEAVRARFNFTDNVPYSLRDMGIDESFFSTKAKCEYDFIYVGSLDRGEIIIRFLDYFAEHLPNLNICLIGRADDLLKNRYAGKKNIFFVGRLDYADVPKYLSKSRYGLNIMPDTYPYNLQTSTKLLEYCAARLDIVSSDYYWAKDFSFKRSANFFWLSPDLSNLTENSLSSYDFKTPNVDDLAWENVISQSGALSFLNEV